MDILIPVILVVTLINLGAICYLLFRLNKFRARVEYLFRDMK